MGFAICLLLVWGSFSMPAARAADTPDSDALHCMALALYWEARREGRSGMMAVGAVVLNRVANREFPNTVCAVIFEGGETPPCQFSWWCDGRSDRPREAEAWALAQEVAAVLLGTGYSLADPTDGALFFHSTSIAVPWRVKRQRTVQIGRHVYYR